MKTYTSFVRSACIVLAFWPGLLSPYRGAGPFPQAYGATTDAEAAGVGSADGTAAPAPISQVPPRKVVLPPGTTEIVDLSQAQVSDSVLIAYIDQSNQTYDLNADQINYLKDLGVSEEVITAMLRRDTQLRERNARLTALGASGSVPTASVGEPTPGSMAVPSAPPAAPASLGGQPPVYSAPGAATAVMPDQPLPVAAPADLTYNYFYDSLAPYGSWMDFPDYGWCWQPTCAVVNPGWRPYCDSGLWLNTDCGWYWQSDYSWGWGPFHYGRWFNRPGCGWAWSPGSVWGPAWVNWRYGDGYCGWAPLPPGAGWSADAGLRFNGARVRPGFGFGLGAQDYTVVPARHFTDSQPGRYAVGRAESGHFLDHSTAVNSIGVSSDRRPVNTGIPLPQVAAATGRAVRQYAVTDTGSLAGPPRPSRPTLQATHLAVFRPTPPPNLKAAPANHLQPLVSVRSAAPTLAFTSRPGTRVAVGPAAKGGSASQPPSAWGAPGRLAGNPWVSQADPRNRWSSAAPGPSSPRPPASQTAKTVPPGITSYDLGPWPESRSAEPSAFRNGAEARAWARPSPRAFEGTSIARSAPAPAWSGSAWRSYTAPQRTFSAPAISRPFSSAPTRSFSAPSFSMPSYSAPARSYSAPSFSSRSYSAPTHSFGGGFSSGSSHSGGRSR